MTERFPTTQTIFLSSAFPTLPSMELALTLLDDSAAQEFAEIPSERLDSKLIMCAIFFYNYNRSLFCFIDNSVQYFIGLHNWEDHITGIDKKNKGYLKCNFPDLLCLVFRAEQFGHIINIVIILLYDN